MKFLYEAQSLILSYREAGGEIPADLVIMTNMLTFVVLWKIKKFKESSEYLETAAKKLNSVIRGELPSKLSKLSTQNLYGIIVMGLAGLTFKLEEDRNKAIGLLEECLEQLGGEDIAARPLLMDLITEIRDQKDSPSATHTENTLDFTPTAREMQNSQSHFPDIPSDFLEVPQSVKEDWLISDEYETIFFLACFVPFITTNTPLIRTSELEYYQQKGQENTPTESNASLIPNTKKFIEPNYYRQTTNLKPVNIQPNKAIRVRTSRNSPRAGHTLNNATKGLNRSWWESKSFLEKVFNEEKTNTLRFRSAPREGIKKLPNFAKPKGDNQGMIFSPSLDPRPPRRPKNLQNRQIMVEFSPGRRMSKEGFPVELIPIQPLTKLKKPQISNKYRMAFDFLEGEEINY